MDRPRRPRPQRVPQGGQDPPDVRYTFLKGLVVVLVVFFVVPEALQSLGVTIYADDTEVGAGTPHWIERFF